jgi:FAD/FMN-containing dehydrogenase
LQPVITLLIWYHGAQVPSTYMGPLQHLQPVLHTANSTNLAGISAAFGYTNDDPPCQHGSNLLRFPSNFERYPVAGLRAVYDIFASLPDFLSNYSAMALEGYSTAAVRAVPDKSTAYQDRYNELLLTPFLIYQPGDEALDREAEAWGDKIRRALVNASGKPLHAYVNYAYGDEGAEALYGYEPWRLERLRALKAQYDPHGKFDYYNPITKHVEKQ